MHERRNRRIWINKLMPAPIMAVCLLLNVCMPLFAHGDDLESPLGDIFPRDEVLQIEITVDQDDWDEIRMQKRSFAEALGPSRQFETVESPFSYVSADVTINGKLFENVGLRKKGFLGSLDSRRPSLKVKLDKYQKGRDIDGRVNLTLNNNKQDTTLMSQFIGYELFRATGVPAPRAALANVTVNGRNLGVYSHIDSVRDPFLNDAFGNENGTLYEGTVVDFYDDWAGGFERKSGSKKSGLARLEGLIQALDIEDDARAEQAIWEVVDQDAFYSFWAMEGLLSFWDGYSGNRNNFFVYDNPETGKLHFIPWGADAMFETYSKLGEDPASPRCVRTVGRLAYRLYQMPSARARYAETMRGLLQDVWNEDAILEEIDRVEAMARPYLCPVQRTSFDPDRIRLFVKERRGMIEPEVSGTDMPIWNDAPEPPPVFGGKQTSDESLLAAAKLGDLDAIKAHLADGADINERDEGGGSALGLAAITGRIDVMRLLIEEGADLDATSNDGGVPLHAAGFFGRYEAVELLLTSGADPNVRNNDGSTPLDVTTAPWNDEMRGIAEFWSGWLGFSVDLDAVESNRPKVAGLLAEHGGVSSMQLPEPAGTMLWRAAKEGDIEAIEKALRDGADPDRLGEKGISPLSWASIMGQDDAVRMLLDQGADINRKNADGGTPLHAAAFLGRSSTVTLLLSRGADPMIRNNNGQTALNTIRSGWNQQMRGIVQYIGKLLEFKVDPDVVGRAWPGITKQLRSGAR